MRADWDLETTVLLISLAIIPVLVAIILLCLKIKSKSNPDLFGVEGNIKKTKNDDAYSPATASDTLNVSAEDSNVRTPSYDRKLPDIPDDIYKNSSSKDDNSELYATVDEVPVVTNGGAALASRTDIVSLPSSSTNHQYAKVKKIRREEHPYAKVGESRDQEDNTDTEDYETTEKLRPRSRERLSGRSINGAASWGRRQDPEIPLNSSRQATPLPPEPPTYPDGHNQQHFSGDSQDSFSAKGYTSISVREPLAHIRGPQAGLQEGNYVTLSETSDEMYAAIEDTVYMNPGGKQNTVKDEEENDPSNMYSKVDKDKKKNNRQTKSYDDPGNSYATVSKPSVTKELSKSSDNLGARPKQRSPRPPEPVDYSEYEVAHTDSRRSQPHLYNMARPYQEDFTARDPNYETLPYAESQLSERDPGYEIVQRRDPDYETVNSDLKDRDPQYETVPPHQRTRVNSLDPGYETVPSKDPGYETVKQPDPGYETVNHASARAARTKTEGSSSDYNRDPGYESVTPGRSASQEPRYEDVYSVVNKKQRSAPAARLPPRKMSELSEEEGYETIPADKREYDPGYETIVKNDRADLVSETASTDPDYARLKDADIEYIDESGDEVEDNISDLKTGE